MTTTVPADDASDGDLAGRSTTDGQPGRDDDRPAPSVAWRPVLVLAGLVGVLMLVTSHWYGLFGDEAYFIAAGRHPMAGYADQPPLVPLLAAAPPPRGGGRGGPPPPPPPPAGGPGGGPAARAAALGGRRRAQLVAAAATAICPYLLATGHLLATSTVDAFCWVVVLWLVVRWIRLDGAGERRDVLLLTAGLVTAVALYSKMLIPVLLGGLVLGVLLVGPRHLLRRPLLWVGMVLALLSTVPTWIWQAHHGWPQLLMREVVRGEAGLFGNRWQFVPRALWYAGVVPGTVLCVVGLWALLRLEVLRPWRSVGVAVVAGTVVLILAGGRPYYETGFYVVLFAAGAVAVQERTRPVPGWWRWTLTPACYVVSGLVAVALVLPVGPSAWRTTWDFGAMGQVGWPELASAVAATYDALPPDQRRTTVVVAFSYWYAASLDQQPATRGLPIFSPHRGYGYLGAPPDGSTALLVGRVRWAGRFCAPLRPLPYYRAPIVDGVNDHVTMALCTPRRPWSQAWPSLQYMD